MKNLPLLIFFLLLCLQLFAQNQTEKKSTKAFDFSGGLSVGLNTYNRGGVGTNRQSPYSYAISGSPTITIYKFRIPFSFTYSDQKFSYTLPYNRYGMSPTYKWAKLHVGYRSMRFSSLTLGGKQFLGAGLELTPFNSKLRVSALAGRLENLLAKKDTIVYGAEKVETYKRNIYGVNIGVGKKTKFDMSFLKVLDDLTSSEPMDGDNTRLLPMDNIVLGMNFQTTILKRFTIKLESAGSLHTNDARSTVELETDDKTLEQLFRSANSMIKTNFSTRWGSALKANANLRLKLFMIGVGYKRVDPYYKSLGLNYMTTDYENYTATVSTQFLQNQIRLNLRGGFQRNNLSGIRQSTNLKTIGGIQLSYVNKNGINANLNYNNITSDQQAGYVVLEDSLRLALTNNTLSFNTGYNWKQDELDHSVNLNLSNSSFRDINEDFYTPIGNTQNNNVNISYNLKHKPSDIGGSFGLNYYDLNSEQQHSSAFGFNSSVKKRFLEKKLAASLGLSLNLNRRDGTWDGYYLKLRNKISYKISKNQHASFNFSWSKRPDISKKPLNETRVGLNYGINF